MLHPSYYADISTAPYDMACLPPLNTVPFLVLPPYLPSSNVRLPQPTWQHSQKVWPVGPENGNGAPHLGHPAAPSSAPAAQSKRGRKQAAQAQQAQAAQPRPAGEVLRSQQQPVHAQAQPPAVPTVPTCAAAAADDVVLEVVPTATAPVETVATTKASLADAETVEVRSAIEILPVTEFPAAIEPPAVAVSPVVAAAAPSVAWRPQLWRGEREPKAPKTLEATPVDPPIAEAAMEDPAAAKPLTVAGGDDESSMHHVVEAPCDVIDSTSADAAWAAGVAGSLDASEGIQWTSDTEDIDQVPLVAAEPASPSGKVVSQVRAHQRKLSDSTTASLHSNPFEPVLGSWHDQNGSYYEVTLDDDEATTSACSVQTTRPDGSVRVTRGLIRAAWSKGCSEKRVTWRSQSVQYMLEPVSANAIRWTPNKGTRGKPLAFDWTRTVDYRQASHEWEQKTKVLEEKVAPAARASRSSRGQSGWGAVWRAVDRSEAVPCARSSKVGRWEQVYGNARWKVKNP